MRTRSLQVALVALLAVSTSLAAPRADADAVAVTTVYEGMLVGPGLAEMYPVDVTEANGSYYVVDPGRYSVERVDRTTGTVLDRVGGHSGRQPGQLGAARAIAADAAGDIYVADTPNHRIQVFSPDLDPIRSWGRQGTAPGTFQMVYGVTVGMGQDAAGDAAEVVYTTDAGRVQKFTLGGTHLATFGGARLNQPRHLAVHPIDHSVYVVSARDREVVVFDEFGVERFRFGGEGVGDGQFLGDIRGIDIDANGRVYVSDDGNHRVQVFNELGSYLYQFGNTDPPGSDGYLTDARGLTVTSEGVVCVADEWDFGLKEYVVDEGEQGATFSRMLGGTPPPAPGVNAPRGIAVNEATGATYVVDWWNQRLQRFGADGQYETQWGRRGTKMDPDSINFAWDAAVRPGDGNVYVANRESHEIKVFDPDGAFVTRWGFRGAATGRFIFPHGVAFDPSNGTLLVADSGNGRIQRFDILASGKGRYRASYGSTGTSPGQFSVPTGIDVEADGTIWVADTKNNRIQRRDPGTGGWSTLTSAAGSALGFKAPWGVTAAPDGSIWVADTGRDRLVQMTRSGELISIVDASTLGIPSMDAPFEVAFGTAGQIYVSVVWDNTVLRLSQS